MAPRGDRMPGLREIAWNPHLSGPDSRLVEDLYVPALARAVHYDRCCAYFSSSVLSAAARGFAGLIHNILEHPEAVPKPAVRLLVNEQLEPADLEALLTRGDQEPLIRELLRRFRSPREALQRQRLQMLAWLAASGWLEVRVGLMRHTGGLLHAKYGVIRDAAGDRLVFMGSGNETAEGLVGNYEELHLFPSWQQPDEADYYQGRFERLWEDQDEHVQVIPLPEAVSQRLISLAPSTPPTSEPALARPELEAGMLWRWINAAPFLPQGEAACDATAPVDMWPHQRRVVTDTAQAFPAGRLLCDEVGLGKTIEAILVLRRLLSGRGVKRALLLVPAGLLWQWRDELREKGGLLVPIWDNGYLDEPGRARVPSGPEVFADKNVLLVSREWARLEANRQTILEAPAWDLVLLDEAHAARRAEAVEGEFNRGNLLLDLLRQLQLRRRARGIILLSGTPMQTQPWEPWDLLSVLGVGDGWLPEFASVRAYYDFIGNLVERLPQPRQARAIADIVASDPEFPPAPDNRRDVERLLAFAPKPQRAELGRWLRSGSPLHRRMHRNTRETLRAYHGLGLIDYAPAARDVQDVTFDYLDQAERRCYEAITRYIDDRFEQLEGEQGGKGFVMTIYRRRAASCPYALRRSLERRREACDRVIQRQYLGSWAAEEDFDPGDLVAADIEDRMDPALPATPEAAQAEKEQIEGLLAQLAALGNTDSKFERFRGVLEEITADGRPALVFTEYYDTLTYLRGLLTPAYGQTLACYSGAGGEIWNGHAWEKVGKAEITDRLCAGSIRVLLCTDAASEGLNLQAASALVNYDLPWNPSKVEQRIGRIDRIGQTQPVLPIRNLFLANSVDERVYELLRERCGLFRHFVGPMQPILALARDALRRGQLGDLVAQVDRSARTVEADLAVRDAWQESAAEPLPPQTQVLNREDLAVALHALVGLNCSVKARRVHGGKAWRLSGLRKRVTVTVDRETLERGPALVPLFPGTGVAQQLADSLPQPGGRVPLVISEYEQRPYRAVEARWVSKTGAVPVASFVQLRELIAAWDGAPPAPAQLLAAQREASQAARARVECMQTIARDRERAGLDSQLKAARIRLLRELGRTLACLGEDLGSVFRTQLGREQAEDGRYHQARRLLGGFPTWPEHEERAIKAYVADLTESQRRTRIAGSQLDAALNDPRWRARG